MTAEEINAYSSIGTMIGIVVVGIMTRLDSRRATKVRNNIHSLVNGNLGIQLKTIANLQRRLFAITRDSKDEQNAIDAEQAYQLHSMKQVISESAIYQQGEEHR